MQIDDNIPIGPRKRIDRYATIEKMEVGQSFAFTTRDHRTISNYVSKLHKKYRPDKQWFVSRKQLRCWRVK